MAALKTSAEATATATLGSSSRVFRLADLPVRRAPNGSESRNILAGRLPTGESVALHESVQPRGTPPNPAHRIQHSEIICVREGLLEFLHDERTERAGAGDVLYVAHGTLHQVRNIGPGPAAYFVLALGGDTSA